MMVRIFAVLLLMAANMTATLPAYAQVAAPVAPMPAAAAARVAANAAARAASVTRAQNIRSAVALTIGRATLRQTNKSIVNAAQLSQNGKEDTKIDAQ